MRRMVAALIVLLLLSSCASDEDLSVPFTYSFSVALTNESASQALLDDLRKVSNLNSYSMEMHGGRGAPLLAQVYCGKTPLLIATGTSKSNLLLVGTFKYGFKSDQDYDAFLGWLLNVTRRIGKTTNERRGVAFSREEVVRRVAQTNDDFSQTCRFVAPESD